MRVITVLDLPYGLFAVGQAEADDVAEIVELLRDDALGAAREVDAGGDLTPYEEAFALVDADPGHLLVLVRDIDGEAVATLQLILLPGLSRGGALRLQLESVRVAAARRGRGIGTALVNWAVAQGSAQGARVAQLTSDAERVEARGFYESLGWTATHIGLKLDLPLGPDHPGDAPAN